MYASGTGLTKNHETQYYHELLHKDKRSIREQHALRHPTETSTEKKITIRLTLGTLMFQI